MNWYGRVGEIWEASRYRNSVCFLWKIPEIFSMPEKLGNVHFSPEVKFLEADWYLGIYLNGELETQEWIGLELWRSYENFPQPVRFSLSIRTADGTEERIHREQIYPEKCRFCGVGKFLQRSYLMSRKSQLAPSNELTVSCRLWRNKPFTLSEDKLFLSSTDYLTSSSDRREEFAPFYSKVKSPVSREPQAEDVPDSGTVEGKRVHPRKKGNRTGKKRTRGTQTEDVQDTGTRNEELKHRDAAEKTAISVGTQTEDVPASISKDEELARLDLKGKTLASHETQTEDMSGFTSKEEELARLDLEGACTLRMHYKELRHSGDDHDVIIKIKGQEFRAHKNVLRARCPGFHDVVKRKVKESTDGSVAIDDYEPDTFDEFLDYVYIGMVQVLTPNKATGLYYASCKYDMPGLKAICLHFLKDSVSTSTICDIILLATRFSENELLHQATTFFAENLVEVMTTDEWKRFLAQNHLLANEVLLKAVADIKKHTHVN